MKYAWYFFANLLLFANIHANDLTNNQELEEGPSISKVKTVFIPISQGSNLNRQYRKNIDQEYIDVSLNYQYQCSNNAQQLAELLFEYNPLIFEGIDIPERQQNALVADYFGLSSFTSTALQISPTITNNIFDIQVSLNFNDIYEGLWLQVNAPITHSKWELVDHKTYLSSMPQINTSEQFDTGNTATLTDIFASINPNNPSPNANPTQYTNLTLSQLNGDLAGADITMGGEILPSQNASATTPFGFMPGTDIGYMARIAIESSDSVGASINPGTESSENATISLDSQSITASTSPLPENTSNSSLIPTNYVITNDNLTNYPVAECALFVPATSDPIPTISITNTAAIPATSLSQALQGFSFGDIPTRQYNNFNMYGINDTSLISNTHTSDVRLADLHIQLGWGKNLNEKLKLNLYAKSIIPTGTHIDQNFAQHVFSPVIGNGRHFELGGGINIYAKMAETKDKKFEVYLDGYATHMFNSYQFRSFDALDLPMSRYMLVKKFTENPDADTLSGDNAFKYIGTLPLGDVNATYADISIPLRGELIIDWIFTLSNLSWGGGYAFSGQGAEKISHIAPSSNLYFYGFKGETFLSSMYAVQAINTANSNTASNDTNYVLGILYKNNNSIDLDATAYHTTPLGEEAVIDGSDVQKEDLEIFPDIGEEPNVNRSGLMNAQILHRIFAHLDYTWNETDFKPHLGFTASLGFTDATHVTARYWDIGLRIGSYY